MLSDKLKSLLELFVRNILSTAEDDSACKFDLIIVEFAEVFHIAFDL